MARRKINPQDAAYSGPSWQRLYRDVYSRTTLPWQTRTGRRNREFASFANLLGLNTAFDDIHKGDGDSPFLRNVRYMGEKQREQRAQVTSRSGARMMGVKGYETIPALPAEYYLELWEGRAIEIDLHPDDAPGSDGLLIGGAIEIQNLEEAKGRLRVILKQSSDQREICDANIPLEAISRNRFNRRQFFFINPLPIKDGLVLRFEVEGDVEPDDCGDVAKGRKIRLRASGRKTHRMADYSRPNVNKCMKEIPYSWTEEPSTVCWEWFLAQEAPMLKGTLVCTNEGQFLVFPVRTVAGIELWRFNCDTNQYSLIAGVGTVDGRSTAVRFAQGLGKLYFVDGYSHLQRIDLSNWQVELALAKQSDIDADTSTGPITPQDMQAQPGASLIIRMRNRIFLSGFAEDPNFVQYSILNSITGTPDAPTENAGVQYDQFSDISWFYSPDKSPKDSTCGPITGFEQFENNLIIFRTNGCSVWTPGSEFAAPSQADMFSYNIGVEKQEDVTNANGSVFLYNRSEGVRRFSGAEATFQSQQIDNELRKIPEESPRFLFAHGNKVRLYCDNAGRGYADHNFIFHTILAQQSPWYCDDNTPIAWVVGDQNSDRVFAMHATYPAIYEVDAVDQFTDFDSSIDMQYHTQYKSPGELSGWTHLRRVLLRLVTSSTNVWFIGVDKNHEDRPSVWRKYVRKHEDDEEIPEGIFGNTADAGTQTINLMLRAKVRDFQVRVFVSCWRDHAMLQYIEGQYGGKNAL